MLDSVTLSLGGVAGVDSTTDAARSSLNQTYDQFLKLLTTQLQNQDPLNPMDTKDMTNQLIALAEVEQSISQTNKLNELIKLNQTSAINSTLLSYIGMNVDYKGSDFTYKGGSALQFDYTVGENAAEATVEIFNSEDQLIWSYTGDVEPGGYNFVWNGVNNDGVQMPEGAYKLKVSAKDINGNPVTAETPVENFNYSRASTNVTLKYTLEKDAFQTQISIFDFDDNLIWSGEGDKKAGEHNFVWSGVDKDGKPVSIGSYYIQVGATDKDGRAIKTSTVVPALVNGVEVVDGAVMLTIGNQKVPIDTVQSVRLP